MMRSVVLYRDSPKIEWGGRLFRVPAGGAVTGRYAEVLSCDRSPEDHPTIGPLNDHVEIADVAPSSIGGERDWVAADEESPGTERLRDKAVRERISADEPLFIHTVVASGEEVQGWQRWLRSIVVDADVDSADFSLRYSDGTSSYAIASLATSLRDARRMGANIEVAPALQDGREWAQQIHPELEAPLSLRSDRPTETPEALYKPGAGYQTSLPDLTRGEVWDETDIAAAAGLQLVD